MQYRPASLSVQPTQKRHCPNAQMGTGNIDSQCNARRSSHTECNSLHQTKQQQLSDIVYKTISRCCCNHNGKRKGTNIFTFIGIYQIGMKRPDSKHSNVSKRNIAPVLRHQEHLNDLPSLPEQPGKAYIRI